jgi:hypothetical protein
MPTATETTKAIQDKVFSNIEVGQKAVVESVRSWAETVETLFTRLPELATADQPLKPAELVESSFKFTEKVVAAQRDFLSQVYEAALPVTRAPQAGAQSGAQAVKNAAPKA